MGFEQKFSKNKIFIQFTKSPVWPAYSKFCQAPKQCELSSAWVNASNEEEVSESFSFACYF